MIRPTIQLSDLTEAVEFSSDRMEYFLDLETGEILYISEDDRFAFGYSQSVPDWQREHLEQIKPLPHSCRNTAG